MHHTTHRARVCILSTFFMLFTNVRVCVCMFGYNHIILEFVLFWKQPPLLFHMTNNMAVIHHACQNTHGQNFEKKKDKAFWTKRTERIKNKNFGGINYSLEHIIIIIIVFRYYATCGTWPLLTKEFIHSKGTCLAHEQRETENKKTQTHPCMEKEYDSVW